MPEQYGMAKGHPPTLVALKVNGVVYGIIKNEWSSLVRAHIYQGALLYPQVKI